VLDENMACAGRFDERDKLLARCVRIKGHRNGAERVCRADGGVKPRAVFTDQGYMRTACNTMIAKSGGKRGRLVRKIAPGQRVPDPVLLFADRGPVATLFKMLQKKPRKGLRFCNYCCRFLGRLRGRPYFL